MADNCAQCTPSAAPSTRIGMCYRLIVIVVNMEIALLTPPVGLNLYVLSSISKVPIGEVIRGIWPFIALFAVYLALITYVPALSLWLPNLVYGG